jgi:uncharacterized protein (TIGR03435 family)
MKPALSVLHFLALTAFLSAQPAAPPVFDAASVKPNSVGGPEGPGHGQERTNRTPTSLTMENIRLSSALKWAYRLQDFQISGPTWLTTERYDIFAKLDSPAPEEEFRRRLRVLLTTRFQIQFHRETKTLPAFVLVVGKRGPTLQKSETAGDSVITPIGKRQPGFTLELRNTSLAQFADRIASSMGATVVDKTGLKDRYNFTLDISRYIPGDAPSPEDLPSILSQAVQEQLGLKLTPQKLPLEILIVDRANPVPTAN